MSGSDGFDGRGRRRSRSDRIAGLWEGLAMALYAVVMGVLLLGFVGSAILGPIFH